MIKIYKAEGGANTIEYNEFERKLLKERPKVILERAYEKVCKEEMCYLFEKQCLDVNDLRLLLKHEYFQA